MTPREKAQAGLERLKEAVVALLAEHEDGLSNAEVERRLGLESERAGGHRGYLSWSILSLLIEDGKIIKDGRKYRLDVT